MLSISYHFPAYFVKRKIKINFFYFQFITLFKSKSGIDGVVGHLVPKPILACVLYTKNVSKKYISFKNFSILTDVKKNWFYKTFSSNS